MLLMLHSVTLVDREKFDATKARPAPIVGVLEQVRNPKRTPERRPDPHVYQSVVRLSKVQSHDLA